MSISYIDGNSRMYQWLNAAGAGMLVVNSVYLGAYPSVGVNAAWAGIAAAMLVRIWWRGPEKPKPLVPAKRPRPNLPKQIQLTYAALKNKHHDIELAIQRARQEPKKDKKRTKNNLEQKVGQAVISETAPKIYSHNS
jgi:hypothetical protein